MTRARGEGGLHWLERRGMWRASWKGRDAYSKTQAGALAKLKAMQQQGAAWSPRRTVADLLAWWLGEHLPRRLAAGAITPGTLAAHRTRARHLAAARPHGIGDVRVADLTAVDVDRHLARLRGSGLAPRTVHSVRATLRTALADARRKGLVPAGATAAELSEPVPAPTVPVAALTADTAARVLAALAGDRLRPWYVTMLALGLRPGETAALTWADVDIGRRSVRVRRNITRLDGVWVVGDSKTHRDVTLALPAVAAAALTEQRRTQLAERLHAGPVWDATAGGTGLDLVFRRPDGRPVDITATNRHLAAVCQAAGVPRMTQRDFARHGAATLLRQAGATLEEVRDLLRHRNVATTEIYSHVTEELRRVTADRMDRLLGG